MTDYIKRDDAIDAIGEAVADGLPKGWYLPLTMIPSADVAPVRHGRWTLDTAHTEENYVKCSVCGQTEVLGYETLTSYCPNCGARMDGRGECDDD